MEKYALRFVSKILLLVLLLFFDRYNCEIVSAVGGARGVLEGTEVIKST